jgi:hypothetical protein
MVPQDPKITEVLPLLYLHGLSSGDFVPALGQFLGSTAGLSGPVITKLTEAWKAERRRFAARGLSNVDYVYLWADGIHVKHPPGGAQAVPAAYTSGSGAELKSIGAYPRGFNTFVRHSSMRPVVDSGAGRLADPRLVHVEELVPDVTFLAKECAEFAKPIGDGAVPVSHLEIEVSA